MNLALENLRVRIAQAWQRRAIALKAASFATVGLINTAVDAAIFFLLLAFVTPSLALANVSAWFVAVTGSYVMNSFTTFSAEKVVNEFITYEPVTATSQAPTFATMSDDVTNPSSRKNTVASTAVLIRPTNAKEAALSDTARSRQAAATRRRRFSSGAGQLMRPA